MLAEFFESPLHIRKLRDGSQGHLLESFAQELCQVGYAVITARRHIHAAALHLLDRSEGRLLGNKDLTEALLSRLRHRCQTIHFNGPSLREPQG